MFKATVAFGAHFRFDLTSSEAGYFIRQALTNLDTELANQSISIGPKPRSRPQLLLTTDDSQIDFFCL